MRNNTGLEYFEAELEDKGYHRVNHEDEGSHIETSYERNDVIVKLESVLDQEVTAVEFYPRFETGRNVDHEDLGEEEPDSLIEYLEPGYEYLEKEHVEFDNDIQEEPFMLRVELDGSTEQKYDEFEEAEEAVEILQENRSLLGAP